ncbi:MAG: aminoacetone oxidase family FAD-binding enzyme [Clostridia bacterium]|nr:aminoacetone oxidase family FAD-binding enzyme [Clostridia bacterium]
MKRIDVAVVGAGASGMLAAAAAAREASAAGKRLKILLFEKEKTPGKKLMSTGNGRCNLANRNTDGGCYSGDKAFIDAVFASFSPDDALAFFRSVGVPVTDDGSGRLYPVSRRAGAVVAALRTECARCGATILCETPVERIDKTDGGFILNGEYHARSVIVAAGGDAGLRRGERCGAFGLLAPLGIVSGERYPCLCGLTLGDYPAALKGVRNISIVSIRADGNPVFTEKGEVQFNADGVSGIPVMQSSLTVSPLLRRNAVCRLSLDLLPEYGEKELLSRFSALAERYPGVPAEQLFGGYLPKQLCAFLMKKIGVSPAAAFPAHKAAALAAQVKELSFPVAGTADFPDAQVSGGGALTRQFRPETLEAKNIPGLYVTGETLDVVGLCGGYNLTWAWCTGYAAGRAASKY